MRNRWQNRPSRLFSRVALFLVMAVRVAEADPRPRSDEPQDADVGRRRFEEGIAALTNGKYEAARIAFQQSYALKPAPAALRNLAASELKTGRYVEAGRHFATYLKTTKKAEIERADVVERGLAEAQSHCGMLLVETNVGGVEIGVDGEAIGRTPLGTDPWLVDPGEHVITARLEGYDDHSERQNLEAGRTLRIAITLRRKDLATLSGLSLNTPPAARGAKTSISLEGRSFGSQEASRAWQPPVPDRYDQPSRIAIAPLVIGGTVTAAGLAVGIGYTMASSASGHDRDALLANIPGTSPKCASGTPNLVSCAQVKKLDDKSQKERTVATAGFVAAGVAGAATLVYWLWPRRSPSQALLLPAVAPAYAGIQWQSNF